MNKLRVSYTLLDLWNRGRVEDAINFYFKLKDIPMTDAIFEGKVWDDIVEQEIIRTGKLPKQFGGIEFKEMPTTQLKLECSLNDELDMVCVFDMFAAPTIYEFKTGQSKSSFEYLSSGQIDMYALACTLNNMKVDKAIVIHYNQHINRTDWAQKWFTESMIKDTRSRVIAKGHEIAEAFRKERLL